MLTPLKYILAVALVALVFIACEPGEPQCYEPNNVSCNLNILRKHIDSDTDTVQGRIVITNKASYLDSFVITARAFLLNDTTNPIVISIENYNTFSVLLNPDTNHIRYKLQFDTTKDNFDTLNIFYHSNLHFISNSCGYTYYFGIDSVQSTYNFLDSIYISNNAVTNSASDRHISLCFFE